MPAWWCRWCSFRWRCWPCATARRWAGRWAAASRCTDRWEPRGWQAMAEATLATTSTAPSASRPRWQAVWRDLAIVVGLVAVAALVRWPNVHVVPPYTDETEEALR